MLFSLHVCKSDVIRTRIYYFFLKKFWINYTYCVQDSKISGQSAEAMFGDVVTHMGQLIAQRNVLK